MGFVVGFLIAFFGMLYLIAVRAVGGIRNEQYKVSTESRNKEFRNKLDEVKNTKEEWLSRVVDESLETRLKYALFKEEPWCSEELQTICGDPKYATGEQYHSIRHCLAVTDEGVKKLYGKMNTRQVVQFKDSAQKDALDVLLANRGKMTKDHALNGFRAYGNMSSASSLSSRENNLEFMKLLDGLLKQHGVSEPLRFLYYDGRTCDPGDEMNERGIYTYHPEIDYAISVFKT